MTLSFLVRRSIATLALLFLIPLQAAPPTATRTDGEDVNKPALREKAGLLPNEDLLFNGWGMTPAGTSVAMSDMALKLVVAPDHKRLVAVSGGFNNTGLTLLDPVDKHVTQFFPLRESWNGLAFTGDGKHILVSGAGTGKLHVFDYANGTATFERTVQISRLKNTFLASIAVHPITGKIYVCNEGAHEILVLNPQTYAIETQIAVGQHPHTCALSLDRNQLYVSNWGSRSVSIVDTKTNRRLRDLAVGLRPNDMVLSPDGRMFVACSGDNSVHVIDTKVVEQVKVEATRKRRPREAAREIISTSLYPDSPEGSTPDAVAVSPDGKTLFIANADNNNVAVVNIRDSAVSVIEGFIPVGWYPTALAVSPDSGTLFVGNGKGMHSRENFPAQGEHTRTTGKLAYDYIGHTLKGSLSFITRPTEAKMKDYTEQVRRNSPFTPKNFRVAPIKSESAIPDAVGEECPIKYILYIIKENRTYDQMLGDFTDHEGKPAGNGDPRLAIYGENVTPNHHQLARDYVLLDNLYCNGEVSLDGHSWCSAAIVTDYRQRNWMSSYSRHGVVPGNDEMDTPAAGYLWDLCRRNGVSFRNYGEGAKRVPSANRGKWKGGRDMDRVQSWIDDLHAAEKKGALPSFTIMSLGEDHTSGTTPGSFTPDASVGSNDLGLARIVEAASKSKFWKEMAIFVIEDDAQNGPDHVDAHRTVGLVISPYCKRNFVDSTFYTTASMLRTMELILGLPPLTQYDAGATPMFNSFQKTAQVTHYSPRMPKVDLMAKNTKKSPFAMESKRMDFSEYDEAPEDELNRILWYVAKGPDVDYPTPIHRMLK
ncbi:MAG: phosphoesterase [Verrucomicrobiales bacterium]|nr:phosphoesterase [Verrucomicrobiales bacterium]